MSMQNLTQIGYLKGIIDTNQGKGIDVQGFAKMGFIRDRTQTPKDDNFKVEPSGNIYYKITPALTSI